MAAATRHENDESTAWLSIQQVAERTGFSEPTLRYYEQVGLIAPVPRDPSSRHRRYAPAAVDRIEALACLRAAGMTIKELRTYLVGMESGRAAAPQMVELFSGHARHLEVEMQALQVRHAYVTAKAALWQARIDDDPDAEAAASVSVGELTHELRGGSKHE